MLISGLLWNQGPELITLGLIIPKCPNPTPPTRTTTTPRDFKGYGEAGIHPHWPNNAKIAIAFVINYEEGGERSVLQGDGVSETNLRENPSRPQSINARNYNAESECEYGSRAGWWRLFRLFQAHSMKFTLYAVARAVELNPDVVARCVAEWHDVASHAHRWVNYHDFPVEKEKEYIRKPITTLKSLTGYAPRGWYYGRPSPHSRTVVPQRDSAAPKACLVLPYSYDCNEFEFHTAGSGFRDPDGLYAHLRNALDVLYEEGQEGMPKMMTVGLHCLDFVSYVAGKEGVWVAMRSEIAEVFRERYPYQRGGFVRRMCLVIDV
ncbi:hypothetical protein BDW62DRAFT_212733 [Aspergillus aurantiobrunneus]